MAVAVLLLRDTPPTLDEAASDLVASGVPGVIVRVRDGDDVRELAKGEASVDDRFRIASVSKTFVAALTLDLAGLGSSPSTGPWPIPAAPRQRRRRDHDPRALSHGPASSTTPRPALLRGELDPRALVGVAQREAARHRLRVSSTNYFVLGFVLQRAALAGARSEMLQRQIHQALRARRHDLRARARSKGTACMGTTAPLPGRHRDQAASRARAAGAARSAWAAGAIVSTAADLDRLAARLLGGDCRATDAARAATTATDWAWPASTPSAARSLAIPATCSGC